MANIKNRLNQWFWNLEQSTGRNRQSEDVINTTATIQSLATTISDAKPQPDDGDGWPANQAFLNRRDAQAMGPGQPADLSPEPQRWTSEKNPDEDLGVQQVEDISAEVSDRTLPAPNSNMEPIGQTEWSALPQDSQWTVCHELAAEQVTNFATSAATLSSTPILDLNLTFQLSSRPSASKVIYLDFNGHTTSGTSWNDATMGSSFYSPAYDIDGNPLLFSDAELIRIQQIWQRVAADFMPFDVNVTLQEPPADWLARTGSSDTNWGVRSVITSYGPSSSSAGGIAFIGSFNSSTDTPVFVYNTTLAGACEAISHEVGHSLWLSHDGTASSTYYSGHGGAGETSWAPVMGSGYSRNVTTWDDGTYTGSNNNGSTANYGKGADDLAVIVGNNGFSYQPDLESNDSFAASILSITGGAVSQFGTIETRLDTDWFSFSLQSVGDINLSFDPYWYRAYVDGDGVWGGATSAYLSRASDLDLNTPYPDHASNLDLVVDLYDSQGVLLYRGDSPGLSTSINLQGLAASTYFLKLDGVGFGDPTASSPTGYTDYASIGHYMITGTITSAADSTLVPVITLALSPSSVSEDGSSNLVYTFTRSLVTANPLSVNFAASGTASNGTDYSGLVAGSNQSVTFAANAATTSVVINPTADSSVEADETVSLTLALGTGYSIGTTTAATGTIINDDSIATPIVFTAQTDILTGTTGADSFALNRLSDALWSTTPDRITNLQAGLDSIDSPYNRTSTIKPKQLGMVQSFDAIGIGGLLTSKNFAKNGASTFTFGDGSGLRTFLAINDAFAGFKANSDSVIEITGYTGNLSTLAIF